MDKERLSSEPLEVLEIENATNFHQFLLNQIMLNRQFNGSNVMMGNGGNGRETKDESEQAYY